MNEEDDERDVKCLESPVKISMNLNDEVNDTMNSNDINKNDVNNNHDIEILYCTELFRILRENDNQPHLVDILNILSKKYNRNVHYLNNIKTWIRIFYQNLQCHRRNIINYSNNNNCNKLHYNDNIPNVVSIYICDPESKYQCKDVIIIHTYSSLYPIDINNPLINRKRKATTQICNEISATEKYTRSLVNKRITITNTGNELSTTKSRQWKKVSTQTLFIPLSLPLPKSVSWCPVKYNIRAEDNTILRAFPYFGESDDEDVDLSCFDAIPGKLDAELRGEVEELVFLYIIEISSSHF